MTESEFEAMLARANQKKQDAQERYTATSQRRTTLLAKAIQTHRVVPNFAEIPAEPTASDLRQRFDSEMNRLIRTHMGAQVGDGGGDDGEETP